MGRGLPKITRIKKINKQPKQTNMKTFIHSILNRTSEEYEQIIFDFYVAYTKTKSLSVSDHQQLVSSQKLWNWYSRQIDNFESEFINNCSESATLKKSNNVLHREWMDIMMKLISLTPKNIILQIRRDARAERFQQTFQLHYYQSKPLYLN